MSETRSFVLVLIVPEEVLGAVISEATDRGCSVESAALVEPEAPAPEQPQDEASADAGMVRARRQLVVDHRAPPVGRRKGVVRPTSETVCGLVLLRELMVGPRTQTHLASALARCGYSEESQSPTTSRLVREGVVERVLDTPETVRLTDAGELMVLADAFHERLVAMGLEEKS